MDDHRRLTDDRPGAPLIVAVSGGPDSLALLLLAHAALGPQLSAITVDHGLRTEGAAEARHVENVCARRGIAHRLAVAPRRDGVHGNVQAWARGVRYAILAAAAQDSGAFVATAHHADDQLETMLMRLNRGSGVAGLACVRARAGAVVRPLLGWRRAELAGVVAACGETAVDDPSNRDDRFDRARLRKHLEGVDWLDPLAATRSAAALDQADVAIEWAVSQAWSRHASILDKASIALDATVMRGGDVPREIKRRLVLRALACIDVGLRPREPVLARALLTLCEGGVVTMGGIVVRPTATHWLFDAAPPRRVPA